MLTKIFQTRGSFWCCGFCCSEQASVDGRLARKTTQHNKRTKNGGFAETWAIDRCACKSKEIGTEESVRKEEFGNELRGVVRSESTSYASKFRTYRRGF